MDPVQIIITVGLVIGALLVLWAVIAGVFAIFAKRSFDKTVSKMDADDDEWRKRHGFRI